METPSESTARLIVEDTIKDNIVSIERFNTGKAHYVYDVKTDSDEVVIRLTKPSQKESFQSAMYWYDFLKPIGVPLATVRLHDITGNKYGFPTIVMDRLPGKDLKDVYVDLSSDEKEELAKEMVGIQEKLSTLKQATGYGYAHSYDDPNLYQSWNGVIDMYLDRIKGRNAKTNLIPTQHIDRLEDLFEKSKDYIDQVKPVPFLDDTTTKNVIVDNGKLSGIVDVDYVCFGDPLFVLALTHMSLIGMRVDTYYTDYWAKLLNLNEEQHRMLSLYAGMYALEFASAMGHTFNKDEPEEINEDELDHLLSSFETLTRNL